MAEQTQNIQCEATPGPLDLRGLIEAALAAGLDRRPGRVQRADGWTPDRIRTFLEALARGAGVSAAAAEAGMTARTAYRLRRRSDPFRSAWDAAYRTARPTAASFASRAIHGFVEPIVRNGKAWGDLYRFDNRHSMSVLTRLDRRNAEIRGDEDDVRIVTESVDEFLDIVCSGDEAAAADFLAALRRPGRSWQP